MRTNRTLVPNESLYGAPLSSYHHCVDFRLVIFHKTPTDSASFEILLRIGINRDDEYIYVNLVK